LKFLRESKPKKQRTFFFVSECKKLYYCKIGYDRKKEVLLAYLVGNKTRGSRVALTDIYEGWDWSATR
jgi:hypothetical protein